MNQINFKDMKKKIFLRSVVCDKNVTDVNQNSKYIVRESIDFGCKVYNVVNTKTCNRVNYFADYESAKRFAKKQNNSINKKGE